MFDGIFQLTADWAKFITAVTVLAGAGYWLNRQIQAVLAEFRPNGGSSLRDAINNIQKSVIVIDARQWAIVAGLTDPMWESDAKGNCIRANRALLELAQRSLEEMAGTGWENIIAKEDRGRVWNEWIDAVERNRSFESTYRVKDKAGAVYEVTALAQPYYDAKNQILGYVGRYSKVTKTAPDGIRHKVE